MDYDRRGRKKRSEAVRESVDVHVDSLSKLLGLSGRSAAGWWWKAMKCYALNLTSQKEQLRFWTVDALVSGSSSIRQTNLFALGLQMHNVLQPPTSAH